jgi:tetratricopeptide (TPR) repeat protein
MAQIEKSVFISYRRTNIYHARATFQDLRANGYDAFMDYETINAGDFGQIILNQIKARAHFLVILTPSALERCAEPDDWLRREIETAIDYKRNIIPLMFDGFDWNSVQKYMTGKLAVLPNYNALKIPVEYFDEAMTRLRTRFLNVPIETILHPTPKSDEKSVAQRVSDAVHQPAVTEAELSASEIFERAYKHSEEMRYNDAIRDYTEVLRLNPNDIHAYNNRGNIYKDKELYDLALADYDEAMRLNPNHPTTYYNRGLVYYLMEQYERAITDFSDVIRLNPQYVNAFNARGYCYLKTERYPLALHDFTEALKISPKSPAFHDSLGDYYLSIGDYDNAIACFDKALQLNPNFEVARQNREIAMQKKNGG